MRFLPQVLFWTLGVIWGSSFIYMKLAANLISPLQIVLVRIAFGLLPIAAYALLTGALKVSHLRHIGHLFLLSLIGTVAYYYGFARAASLLDSAIVGALSGLTPIFAYLLALLLRADETAKRLKILGIAIGFLGVLLIARPSAAGYQAADFEGVLYALLGSASIGASFVYVKRYVLPLEIPASALITYQLAIGLLLLLPLVDLRGIAHLASDIYVATGLVVGLGLLGTGVAFILYYYIIDRLGGVAAATVAYIPPLVALAIGVILAGEQVEAIEYAGAALILFGLALVNRG